MDIKERSLELHERLKGKLEIKSKVEVKTKDDLSLAYTPGVAEPCLRISKNKEDVYKYTIKGNTVAIISNGTAVLGLGNIGAAASIPVMEGKAVLFKELAGLDAFPIAIKDQDDDKDSAQRQPPFGPSKAALLPRLAADSIPVQDPTPSFRLPLARALERRRKAQQTDAGLFSGCALGGALDPAGKVY